MRDIVLENAISDYDGQLPEEAVERLVNRYRTYVKPRSDPTWEENMYAFLDFAAENGYQIGCKVFRQEKDAPFGPGNCYFAKSASSPAPPARKLMDSVVQRWDRCVYEYNRERVAAYKRRHE